VGAGRKAGMVLVVLEFLIRYRREGGGGAEQRNDTM